MPEKMPDILIAHIPVIHAGYLDMLDRHADLPIGILDTDVLAEETYLAKDIRALRPEQSLEFLKCYGSTAKLLGRQALMEINETSDSIIMPDEDITRKIGEKYLRDAEITYEPTFLRWHRDNVKVNKEVNHDTTIDYGAISDTVDQLYREADRSNNMWRRVGAAILSEDQRPIVISRNQSVPDQQQLLYVGDPRNIYKRGDNLESSIDIHAEAAVIVRAASEGIRTEGCTICVTTFPCPTCAKLIAGSGIKKCYYIEGYATLDGEEVLKAGNVEIIRITGVPESVTETGKRQYPPAIS